MKYRKGGQQITSKSKKSEYNRRYGMNNNIAGLCFFCKNNKLETSNLCEQCYYKTTAQNILKDRNRWGELQKMWGNQHGKCYLTGKELILGVNASIDHLFPVTTHPHLKHEISNLAWCDYKVNFLKRNLTKDELVEICRLILENHR